jgi:hypothetical protein
MDTKKAIIKNKINLTTAFLANSLGLEYFRLLKNLAPNQIKSSNCITNNANKNIEELFINSCPKTNFRRDTKNALAKTILVW